MNKFSSVGLTGSVGSSRNIKVRYDLRPIADNLNRRITYASQQLAERVRSDTEKFVPIATDELRGSAKIVNKGLGFSLVYTAPYANDVYWDYKRHAPPTCRLWFETARAVYKDDWVAELQRYIDNAK